MRQELSQDGVTVNHYLGPWHVLVKMSRVLCEDGKERTINVGTADTYFSVPGRTRAKGKTVTGFVSFDDDLQRWTFKATGKNAGAINGSGPGTCHRCPNPATWQDYQEPHMPYCETHKPFYGGVAPYDGAYHGR